MLRKISLQFHFSQMPGRCWQRFFIVRLISVCMCVCSQKNLSGNLKGFYVLSHNNVTTLLCYAICFPKCFFYIHLILNDLSGITENMKLGSREVAFLSISRLIPFFKSMKTKIKRKRNW